MSLQKTLDAWAEKLSKKAADDKTPLQESIDAFKAVTAYFAAKQKTAKKTPDADDADGGFSFTASDEVIHGRTPKIRAGRNS